jgi:hypothetical protein
VLCEVKTTETLCRRIKNIIIEPFAQGRVSSGLSGISKEDDLYGTNEFI